MTKTSGDDRVLHILRTAARYQGPDADALLLAIYRPFDDRAKQRFLDAVSAQLQHEREERGSAASLPARFLAYIRGLFSARGQPVLLAAAFVCMAALAVVARPADHRFSLSTTRGASTQAQVLTTPDAHFEEIIGSDSQIQDDVVVLGAVLERDGDLRRWDAGACSRWIRKQIFISGTRAELFAGVPAGAWNVAVAVGRHGEVLSDREILSAAGEGWNGRYEVVRDRVVIEGTP